MYIFFMKFQVWKEVRIYTLFLLLSILPCDLYSVENSNNSNDIVLRSLDLLGVELGEKSSLFNTALVSYDALEDTTTPFLNISKEKSGNFIQKVMFNNLIIGDLFDIEDYRTCNIHFYFDSIQSQLLKIDIFIDSLDPNLDFLPNSTIAEDQLRSTGEEYVGIPDTLGISLIEALIACKYNPLKSKKIVAQYIQLKDGSNDIISVWVLTLWGIPPIVPRGGNGDWIPIYQRNHIRQVVDGSSGLLMYTSTFPNAPLTKEDRERLFPKQE